jgi:hypothetical protein
LLRSETYPKQCSEQLSEGLASRRADWTTPRTSFVFATTTSSQLVKRAPAPAMRVARLRACGAGSGAPLVECRPPTSPGPAATPISAPRRACAIGKTAGLEAKGAGSESVCGIGLPRARTRVCLRSFRSLDCLCPNVFVPADRRRAAIGASHSASRRLNGS